MQCAFQLVLDRELNGHKLHPDTRVFCAINATSDYQVNEIDPALLDRFWVIDLEPDTEDWIKWAKENDIDSLIIDFIKQNPAHLRHEGQMEPGKVYPTPRSYERLDRSLKFAGLTLQDLNLPRDFTGRAWASSESRQQSRFGILFRTTIFRLPLRTFWFTTPRRRTCLVSSQMTRQMR